MKARTIKTVLRRKVHQWLESITNEVVRKAAAQNTIVTGGSIASMLLGEKVSDFDIYFRDLDTAKLVTRYYVEQFNTLNGTKWWVDESEAGRVKIRIQSAGIDSEASRKAPDYRYFESTDPESGQLDEYVDAIASVLEEGGEEAPEDRPPYRPIFLSANAITLANKVQVVIRFQGTPEEIHENFDFVHCMNWWSSWDGRLELRADALEALLARELRFVGSRYPLCSIFRSRKFIHRGWSINAGQYLKMALLLNEMDLKDPETLEDQLTGVDVAYFTEILEKIKEDNKPISTSYLIAIIDKMF
jgi:hypothetical protein